MKPAVRRLGDLFWFALASFASPAWVAAFPHGADCSYLMAAYNRSHPGWLGTDWSLGRPHPKSLLFDQLVGLLTSGLGLEWGSYLGRVGLTVLVVGAWFYLARRHLKMSSCWAALGFIAWVGLGESLIGGENVVGYLWPKGVGWAAGLWAVNLAIERRAILAGVLLGFAVAVQPSVGLAVSAGVGIAMIGSRRTPREIATLVVVAVAVAAPWLLTTLGQFHQPGLDAREAWRFETFVRWGSSVHLELGRFRPLEAIATSLMVVYLWWIGWRSENPAVRFLGWIELGAAGVFAFGAVAWLTGRYELLAIYPFRGLPVFALAFFLMAAARPREVGVGRIALAPRGLLLIAAVGAAVGLLPNALSRTREPAVAPELQTALEWVRDHTAPTATIVVSPVQQCVGYWSRRGQVVVGELERLDQMAEYRARMEAHVGPWRRRTGTDQLDARFNRLSADSVAGLVGRYGGDVLVTQGRYPFPELFAKGGFRVYDLSGLKTPPS